MHFYDTAHLGKILKITEVCLEVGHNTGLRFVTMWQWPEKLKRGHVVGVGARAPLSAGLGRFELEV